MDRRDARVPELSTNEIHIPKHDCLAISLFFSDKTINSGLYPGDNLMLSCTPNC